MPTFSCTAAEGISEQLIFKNTLDIQTVNYEPLYNLDIYNRFSSIWKFLFSLLEVETTYDATIPILV